MQHEQPHFEASGSVQHDLCDRQAGPGADDNVAILYLQHCVDAVDDRAEKPGGSAPLGYFCRLLLKPLSAATGKTSSGSSISSKLSTAGRSAASE